MVPVGIKGLGLTTSVHGITYKDLIRKSRLLKDGWAQGYQS